MTRAAKQGAVAQTTGSVIHWAFGYDFLVWLATLGRERNYREKTLDLASLRPGESVLDVGCGTGTLAIAAKRRVGRAGRVCGIDASPEMIARARNKAKKDAMEVAFENALVEKLPFPDGTFDAVLSTTMLHHLGDKTRRLGVQEMRRVLRPRGRLLVIDFVAPARESRSWIGHSHRHGHIDLRRLLALLGEAGFVTLEKGAVGLNFGMLKRLHFVLAASPGGDRVASSATQE